jgi:hypothetical protein
VSAVALGSGSQSYGLLHSEDRAVVEVSEPARTLEPALWSVFGEGL